MRIFLIAAALAASSYAGTITITVPGTADYHGAESAAVAVSLSGMDLTKAITFSTTSVCGFNFNGGCGPVGASDNSADGGGFSGGSSNGGTAIASALAPYDSLIGVFLNPANLTSLPSQLDFINILGTAFPTLSPNRQQAFFIGDGLSGRGIGSVQTFFAPAGATFLWLGDQDGGGWSNNGGQQTVTISFTDAPGSGAVPEPSSALLVLGGSVMVFGLRRKLA